MVRTAPSSLILPIAIVVAALVSRDERYVDQKYPTLLNMIKAIADQIKIFRLVFKNPRSAATASIIALNKNGKIDRLKLKEEYLNEK